MAKFASRAERLRHHRKCFELGLKLGVTPKDAERMLDEVETRQKHRAKCAKLGHQSALRPLTLPVSRAEFERFDSPWMMRD